MEPTPIAIIIQTLPNSVSNPIRGSKGKQIDDEVIIATVDEPWAVFKNAAIKNGIKSPNELLNERFVK